MTTDHPLPGPATPNSIPFRLRVGVVGHRDLSHDAVLRDHVEMALRRVRRLVPSSALTPLRLTIVSALAEGADQLVAQVALDHQGTLIEAILPMPRQDYALTRATPQARHTLAELLDRAVAVDVVEAAPSLAETRSRAHYDVVERCDVLIALWDGLPSHDPGEPAEIVAAARDQGIPLLWIETSATPRLHEEHLTDCFAHQFDRLDQYNRERLDHRAVARRVAQYQQFVLAVAGRFGLDRPAVVPFCRWVLPAQLRADVLAERYQRRFFSFGITIFLMAAAATVTVSFQEQLLPNLPLLSLVEIAFIAVNWLIVFVVRDKGRVQERWTAYRALSEALRARFFLAMLETPQVHAAAVAPRLPARCAPDQWVERAVEELWRSRPPAPAEAPLAALKQFVAQAWLGDQLVFMQARRQMHVRRRRRIARLANLGWALAVGVVVLHAFGAQPTGTVMSSLLIMLAIGVPAFVGALQAIGEQGEDQRHAARYEQMEVTIAALARHMERAATQARLATLAVQAEGVLLAENRTWGTTVRFRDLAIKKIW